MKRKQRCEDDFISQWILRFLINRRFHRPFIRPLYGNYGFSLIELLIVMIIMGLLASLVGPRMFGKLGMAKEKTARSQMAMLLTSLDSYRLDTGRYPTEEQGLEALSKNIGDVANWRGPYLAKELPVDPWGNDYIYRNPGEHAEVELLTLGLDGKEGGQDENTDLGSWE